jgi:hypothetical protein
MHNPTTKTHQRAPAPRARGEGRRDRINAITRSQLAMLLDDESHSVIAEHIRAGSEPRSELGDGSGGLRKALSRSRYDDGTSHRAQAIYAGIVAGTMRVEEDGR